MKIFTYLITKQPIIFKAPSLSAFTLNLLAYNPTGPASSNIYRPEFENYINDH
jgi:hypothetical protein